MEVRGDGVQLHVRDDGNGAPVLLLHGFPDTGALWRHQVAALTGAGMRTIVPDLRGRGASERPAEVADYAIARSVADMLAVIDALDVERCDVISHDWGAAVGWALASLAPQRVRRLVAMSVGHPNALRERTIEQREKAWYQLLFCFEGVAEELLRRDDWGLAREWLRGDGDVDAYIEELSRPGALTAGLNWYRANVAPQLALKPRRPLPPVQAPTLALWSSRDNYLVEDGMLRSEQFVDGPWRYERIEGASHWLQLDEPKRINALLLAFLG